MASKYFCSGELFSNHHNRRLEFLFPLSTRPHHIGLFDVETATTSQSVLHPEVLKFCTGAQTERPHCFAAKNRSTTLSKGSYSAGRVLIRPDSPFNS